ncbi:MAG: sigma-54 dependent transcriptional regulator [Firmicutes bacterium]|nr:sigma-54 dependent transcriptional regulator [Bacillota bacterium]
MDKEAVDILFIDDDETILEMIYYMFKDEAKYNVTLCDTGEKGLEALNHKNFDLVITDMVLPEINGMELIDKIKETMQDIPILMLSGFDDVPLVVDAMKRGASDYLTKPIEKALLFHSIEKAIENRFLKEEVRDLRQRLEESPEHQMVAKSPQMKKIFDQIRNLADTDTTVLILGETGTGKELVAEALHHCSVRKEKPLIKINCAALSEPLLESELFGHEKGAFTSAIKKKPGKFEIADGGTIFLDEIGDIPPRIQSKLLRVLQEREFERVGGVDTIKVDVRIIAATNANLEKAMEAGLFRRDLYYRLNVFPIHVPPLRERMGDVPLLAMHFLKTYSKKFNRDVDTISREVLDELMVYNWPGNVRELENIIERAVITCSGSTIEVSHLDGAYKKHQDSEKLLKRFATPESAAASRYSESEEVFLIQIDSRLSYKNGKDAVLQEYERKFINQALTETRGSVSKTADIMGISMRSVYEKMKHYNLDKSNFRG